jgi:hypothetical protein
MNWKHIEAMLRGSGRFQWAVLNGEHLVSNGSFAVRRGGSTAECVVLLTEPQCVGEPYSPLANLWSAHEKHLGVKSKIGGHPWKFGGQFCREIDEEWIDEAYFRCFPGAVWSGGLKRSLMAHVDGRLMGIVMPTGQRGEKLPALGTTDAEVFSPYSNERNDWYLLTREKISSEIEDLCEHIEANEEKIKIAEEENDYYRREIESLERLAKERFHPVEPAALDAKTDGSGEAK